MTTLKIGPPAFLRKCSQRSVWHRLAPSDDKAFSAELYQLLKNDSRISVDQLEVEVDCGIVILRGTAGCYYAKQQIQEVLMKDPAIERIENQIDVVKL